jgi:hypothetical protein
MVENADSSDDFAYHFDFVFESALDGIGRRADEHLTISSILA